MWPAMLPNTPLKELKAARTARRGPDPPPAPGGPAPNAAHVIIRGDLADYPHRQDGDGSRTRDRPVVKWSLQAPVLPVNQAGPDKLR
jgi:hypothetical protein